VAVESAQDFPDMVAVGLQQSGTVHDFDLSDPNIGPAGHVVDPSDQTARVHAVPFPDIEEKTCKTLAGSIFRDRLPLPVFLWPRRRLFLVFLLPAFPDRRI
jgi:hypothetical protein